MNPERIAAELGLPAIHVRSALALLQEGATIPFIARYRKERTGEMNEVQLRALAERHAYLTELEERKEAILKSIGEQGKLTPELEARIRACLRKTDLEDLYLPFRPRRRTRATAAREKGLEPLAERIRSLNTPGSEPADLRWEAEPFVSAERGVATVEEALQGASDILAEEVSEKAELRLYLRDYMAREAFFVSRIKREFPAGTTRFESYRDYRVRTATAAPHAILALLRGENEGILTLSLEFDAGHAARWLESREIRTRAPGVRAFLQSMLADAFDRLIRPALTGEIRQERKEFADRESVKTFEANLRNLLLASPAGMKPTLGIDPGFRTGCKVAAVDVVGKLAEHATLFPHGSEGAREEAARLLRRMIQAHAIQLIGIGNGTAGRETDRFVAGAIDGLEPKPVQVLVSEAGASVYSAGEAAIEEFPDLDLTVRSAVSIARRLQDLLAELVKIDPKSIGVGQYQHDVDQKMLKSKLEETVESCVNFVGVDLNLASRELLRHVSGITDGLARNILEHRNQHGAFRSRNELRSVARFGPKAFEQAAGFLRIRGGDNPLDNTAVHPESYGVVRQMARDLGVPLSKVTEVPGRLRGLDLKKYVGDTVGEPTLRDILTELEKPGRDPRAEFRYASFRDDVRELSVLKPGMLLEGVVTNVANFGAFVDIGVHQDGLVHVSQMADRFVSDPKEVVKAGQIVQVRVLEVNEALKRISLSMKSQISADPRPLPAGSRPRSPR